MFQTTINHFFQSFESPFLTSFMRFITTLGYMEFFIFFLLLLTFGIDYKKGFILFQVLLWTAAVTFIGKNYFELPRPFHVDNTLQFLDGQLPDENTFTFSKRGAKSFWEPLPADVLEVTRKTEHMEYGFPSGHSSIAIAFWGTLLCLFRQKWVRGICIALMILIPISRLYLGVHFLADVLGGIALGGLCWYIAYAMILKSNKRQAFFQQHHYPIALNSYSFFLLLLPLVYLYLLPSKVYILPAFIIGSGLGFLLLSQKGIPLNEGTPLHRLGRTAIGILLFISMSFILKKIVELVGMEGQAVAEFFKDLLSGLVLFWLVAEIAIKFGWYRRSKIV